MMQATAAPVQPAAAVPPPPSKAVQVTDVGKELENMTLGKTHGDNYPSEKLMLKLEALPKGKHKHRSSISFHVFAHRQIHLHQPFRERTAQLGCV